MTDENISVIAVDAADYALAREFGCENILLDNSAPLETTGYECEYPHTMEIWPMIATGTHPSDHGLYRGTGPDWDSSTLALLASVSSIVPDPVKTKVGELLLAAGAEAGGDDELGSDTPFGRVLQWPGVTEIEYLEKQWDTLYNAGEQSPESLHETMMSRAGKTMAWLAAVDGLSAAHIHTLDVAGHLFADDRETLSRYYRFMDHQVGIVRELVDDVIVISDHGMQVSWMDDDEPGQHSWRATIATTDGIDRPLPRHVEEVHDWLSQIDSGVYTEETEGIDVPEDQLKQLGYI